MIDQDSVSVEFLKEAFNSLPTVNDSSYYGRKLRVPIPAKVSVEVNEAPLKPILMRYLTFEYNYSLREWEMMIDA